MMRPMTPIASLRARRRGLDFIYGDAFPHETNMDRLHGVDFDKGCYVGQKWCRGCSIAAPRAPEHCGSFSMARRRKPGAAIVAGDKPVGTMGSSAAGRGLALIRIDRAADALRAGTSLTSGASASASPSRTICRPRRSRPCMTRSARLHADGLTRCPWPGEDPFYMAYHDTEWGVPEYDDRALYEKLMLDGFQAGLSWITILRKRDNFRRAFDDFQPHKIARYDARKVHALMNDAGIVRNRAKIEARWRARNPI